MVTFFETLRIEVGPEIKITIVTPGFIESEMTQGKFLVKEGKMEVDQDLRDVSSSPFASVYSACLCRCANFYAFIYNKQVQVSTIPVGTARGCAEAIVNSACRGDRYLTQPAWFKVTYFWMVFFPEVIEWCYRLMYINRPGTSDREAPSKKILDLTGAKNILYPSTLHTPDIKTD